MTADRWLPHNDLEWAGSILCELVWLALCVVCAVASVVQSNSERLGSMRCVLPQSIGMAVHAGSHRDEINQWHERDEETALARRSTSSFEPLAQSNRSMRTPAIQGACYAHE